MLKKVRRIFLVAVCMCFLYVLQTTVCSWIVPYTAAPNLLLILTMSIGLLRGKMEGMFVGVFCGLLLDIFSGGMIGFYAIIYMYIGYFNGMLKKSFVSDMPLLPMILCGVSELVYHMYIFIFNFLVRNRLNLIVYWQNVIMPELIVTILANILIYWLILSGNTMLERKEKVSVSKYIL